MWDKDVRSDVTTMAKKVWICCVEEDMDKEYWKKAYKDTWGKSSERERNLRRFLERQTGLKCDPVGLGAESREYISGDARSNGYEKGDADCMVRGTNIYIEITGPLTKNVGPEESLWFRPDKIENAVRNGDHDVFFAHHCPAAGLWRVIHIDDDFKKRFLEGKFPVRYRMIRRRRERYVEIAADDPCIHPLDDLVAYLKYKGDSGQWTE